MVQRNVRLAHRLLSRPLQQALPDIRMAGMAYPALFAYNRLAQQTLQAGCEVIIADNVSHFYHYSEKMYWGAEDFPNQRLPFENVFVEWTIPDKIFVNTVDKDWKFQKTKEWHEVSIKGTMCGCLIHEEEADPKIAVIAPPGPMRTEILKLTNDSEYVWICVHYTAAAGEVKNTGVNFKFIRDGQCWQTVACWSQHILASGFIKENPSQLTEFDNIPCLTVSFLNTKGTEVVKPPEDMVPTEKQSRKMKVKGIEYKILHVRGMADVIKQEKERAPANGDQEKLKKRLHIVRGHFATYTKEKPLFGKYDGTFWKTSHTRGSSDVGEIRKDYSVG